MLRVTNVTCLNEWVFATVKMRGGGAPGEDAARFAAVRSVYSEPHSVAIDFVCRANVESARAFLREVGAERAGEPMWVEDPVPYGAIHELDQRDGSSRIAAGESCGTVAELLELRRAGVGMLILDVEFLGGPLRFLETARTLQALGCEVGSHMFAFESLHLLAALPGSMPVEVIDWCSALFNEKPAPDAGGRLAVRGPGFGRSLCLDTLSRYGRRMP